MEIPTKEIIKQLRVFTTTPVALAAIEVIEAQALEIRELQTTICRLKVEIQQNYDDYRISSALREAGIRTGE